MTKHNPGLYFGNQASRYLEKRIGTEHWRKESEAMEQLIAHLPDGGVVLDVPFGTGRFVDLFLTKGMKIYGLDSSSDMEAEARKFLGDKFNECDFQIGFAQELPYPDRMFDLVVCFRFLTGIASYQVAKKTLSELRRVCRGYAMLSLRNRLPELPPVPGPQPDNTKIASNFSRNQIVELLTTQGFRVLEEVLIRNEAWKDSEKRIFLCR